MKENNFFKKIRDRDWKKLLTAKNFIIVGCMLLIGAAVLISSLVAAGNGTEAAMGEESTKILGNTVLAGGTVNNTPDNTSEPVSDTGTKAECKCVCHLPLWNKHHAKLSVTEFHIRPTVGRIVKIDCR